MTCRGDFDEDYFRYILKDESYICKATMSFDDPSTSLVMAIVEFGKSLIYCVCRPGIDTNWSSVKAYGVNDHAIYDDVRFFKGKFYAVRTTGGVFVIDDLDDVPRLLVVSCSLFHYPQAAYTHYLVESLGELFVVMRTQERCGAEIRSYKTNDINVSILHLDKPNSWVNVDDLGINCAFFVGCYSAFCLSTLDYPSCKENSIYFTDDCVNIRFCFSGRDVLGLICGVIEKCYSNDTGFRRPPPVWFSTKSG